jgi:hypothetical protein
MTIPCVTAGAAGASQCPTSRRAPASKSCAFGTWQAVRERAASRGPDGRSAPLVGIVMRDAQAVLSGVWPDETAAGHARGHPPSARRGRIPAPSAVPARRCARGVPAGDGPIVGIVERRADAVWSVPSGGLTLRRSARDDGRFPPTVRCNMDRRQNGHSVHAFAARGRRPAGATTGGRESMAPHTSTGRLERRFWQPTRRRAGLLSARRFGPAPPNSAAASGVYNPAVRRNSTLFRPTR